MACNFIKCTGSKMLVLSETNVRACLPMAECLKINREALMSIASPSSASMVGGVGDVPTRLGLPGPLSPASASPGAAEDWTLFKPAAFYANADAASISYNKPSTMMGMKIVSIRAQNPANGLPLVPATIMVVDAESGICHAVLSATYLTGARTAASSGLATQLSRPDLEHLVIFGAGLQAECHLDAIQTAIGRKIPKITIINRTQERAEALKEKISSTDGNISIVDIVLLGDTASVESAVSTADVICATTNATTPLFDGQVLSSGCHINGIGSYTPYMCEIPASAVNRSRILIDAPEAKSVGDLKHLCEADDHPMNLLGDILAAPESWSNRADGNDAAYDLTFYKGVGTAIQDVMTADLVVRRARELGIGTEIDMT